MKKQSKIVALILCIALVLSALAIAVSAATKLTVSASGVENFATDDMQSTSLNAGTDSPSSMEAGLAYKGKNRHGLISTITNGENKFVTYWNDGAVTRPHDTNAGNPYVGIKAGKYGTGSAKSIMNYDFMTIDFDICSDKYIGADGKFADEGNELAFAEVDFGTMGRYNNGSGDVMVSRTAFWIKQDSNGWYVVIDGGDEKYYLPTVAGEWTHITYLYDIDTSKTVVDGKNNYDIKYSDLHIYVNGVHLGTIKPFSNLPASVYKGTTDYMYTFGYDQVRMSSNAVNNGNKYFSIGFDNISVNYYGKGYTGQLSQVEDFSKISITECDDVIFNASYEFPTPNVPVATITAGEVTTNYYTLAGALSKIDVGGTLTTNKALTNLEPNCVFFIKTAEGVPAPTLSESALLNYVIDYDSQNDVYVVKEADSSTICNVVWDPDDEAGIYYEGQLSVGSSMNYAGDKVFVPTLSADAENAYRFITGWEYELDGERLPIEEVTQDIVDYAIDSDYGALYIYPVFENKYLEFTVINNGALYVPDNGAEAYLDIENFKSVVSNAPTGSVVKLYADFEANQSPAIALNGRTLSFDLNGHKFYCYGSEKKAEIFSTSSAGSNFTLYSSVAGAEIIHTFYNPNSNMPAGGAVVYGPAQGSTVNFGLPGTEDDGNLTVYCTILFDSNGPANTNPLQTPSYVNIDGVNVIRVGSDSYGFLICRNNDVVNVKNSFIYSYKDSIFGMDDRYSQELKLTIDGSVVIAGTNGDANILNGQLSSGSTIVFTNSAIFGKIDVAKGGATGGNVTVGENVVLGSGFTYGTDNKFVNLGENMILVGDTDKSYTFDIIKVVYPSKDESPIESYKAHIETTLSFTGVNRTVDSTSLKYATVNWYDADGNLIYTDDKAAVGFDASFNGSVPKVKGNNWFDKGLTYWSTTKGGEKADLTIAEEGTYNFYAVCETPVIGIKGVKYNLSLFNKFNNNFYVPLNFTEADGITAVNVYTNSALTSRADETGRYSIVTIGDVQYVRYYTYPTPINVESSSIYVTYTLTDGTETDAQRIEIAFADYFEAVLYGEYNEVEKSLVVNTANYCNEVIKAYKQTETGFDRYEEIINTFASLVIDTNAEDIQAMINAQAAEANIPEEAREYIAGTSVIISAVTTTPSFALKYTDKLTAADFGKVSFTHYDHLTKTNVTNWMAVEEGGYFYNKNYNVHALNTLNNFTFTVTDGEKSVSAVYNLAAYINAVEAAGESAAYARAYYGYALSVIAYRTFDPTPAPDFDLTIEEAITMGEGYAHNTYTEDKYYVTGIITNVYNTQYGNMYITDGNGKTLTVYGLYSNDGSVRYDAMTVKPVKGDVVTVYGVIGNYSGTAQMKNGWLVNHEVHEECELTEADCNLASQCKYCGKVVGEALGHADNDGNGLCDRCSINLETSREIVFEFGANGAAGHVDGNDIGTSKNITENGNTMKIESASKVYFGAKDEKGNSCIKIGTGSATGSFSFTVSDDVTKVIIKVAMYKAKTTKLNINGVAYSITTSSNNGEYTEIEIDTTTTKKVTFSTVGNSTGRAMIDSITWVIEK